MEASGRTVFFLTEFQINGMLEALRSDLVDRRNSFRLMEGMVLVIPWGIIDYLSGLSLLTHWRH